MSAISVRRATAADGEEIADFNAAMALETEGKRLDGATLRRGVAGALSDRGRGDYFVAEIDGSVAGCLLITREWSDWRNGWFWWIQSVYVPPAYRGRGVYSALHHEVLAEARSAGDVVGVRLYVERGNDRAQRTYRRLGMRDAGYFVYEQLV